jgi:hypothetical protein
MSGVEKVSFTRGERVQRILMVSGAVILFVLGILLLVEPLKARDADRSNVMDNVGGTVAADRSCA